MNEIKVGDLVVIVRKGNCGHATMIGTIFQVSNITVTKTRCMRCGHVTAEAPCAWGYAVGNDRDWAISLWRLRRIPPLWELDETEHKEELPA